MNPPAPHTSAFFTATLLWGPWRAIDARSRCPKVYRRAGAPSSVASRRHGPYFVLPTCRRRDSCVEAAPQLVEAAQAVRRAGRVGTARQAGASATCREAASPAGIRRAISFEDLR